MSKHRYIVTAVVTWLILVGAVITAGEIILNGRHINPMLYAIGMTAFGAYVANALYKRYKAITQMTNMENPSVQAALTELGNYLKSNAPPHFASFQQEDPQLLALNYIAWTTLQGAPTLSHAINLIAAVHACAVHKAARNN